MAGRALVETTAGASGGIFQSMRKIRGLQVDIQVEGAPESWNSDKDIVKIYLEDVAVLEMEEGEEAPELNDDKFAITCTYALPGKEPNKRSKWIRGAVASAEALGKVPSEFNGEYVTMVQVPIDLGFKGTNDEPVAPLGWVYVADDESASSAIQEYITELLLGKNPPAARRALLVDARAKQYPEYKDALTAETIEELLPITIEDGKYVRVVED